MNDFTKEFTKAELIYLHNHIDFEFLKDKIQSMIDSYHNSECEHKWIKCLYGDHAIPINLCVLCNFREKR